MRKNLFYFLLVISLVTNIKILAQQIPLPFLRDVTIKSSTRVDPSTGIYFYTYTVQNGTRSVGKLISFEIDISRDSLSVLLDDSGLQFKNSRLEDAYRRIATRLGNQIIPVSFPSLPTFCDAGITVRRTVDFFRPLIRQGQQVTGYVLSSRGIPGIKKFVAIPQFEVNDYYPSADEVSNPDSLAEKIDADREAIKFRGMTIGPIAPPANFVATVFLDTLISYKHQARALGWIKSPGIVTSLDQKLENARKQLQNKDNKSAKNILQAFVNEVEALNKQGNQLTSEAFALLKFNAEFLISKL